VKVNPKPVEVASRSCSLCWLPCGHMGRVLEALPGCAGKEADASLENGAKTPRGSLWNYRDPYATAFSRTSPPPHLLALALAWFAVAAPRLAPTALILGGLLRKWKQKRRILFGLAAAYCANYLYNVRRVHLRLGREGGPSDAGTIPPLVSAISKADGPVESRLLHIVQRCPHGTGRRGAPRTTSCRSFSCC